MTELDKSQKYKMGIGRFSRFVVKYLYDTDWYLIATCCGVTDILNKHERVTRAQSWRDEDYPTAISRFLINVFDFNEDIGLLLITEISSQNTLSDDDKIELNDILKYFNSGDIPIQSYIQTFSYSDSDKLIYLTTYPDDFYKILVDEINFQYISKHPISLSILIRKLFENLLIDILRKKYGTHELSEYYDAPKRRFHDFSVLLKNIDKKKADFHYISPNLDTAFIAELNKYREYGNAGAHSIDINLKIEDFTSNKSDLNYKVNFLVRIFNHIS
jgi:hypothetical protein